MLSFLSPSQLAQRSARHPWITVGIWILIIVAGVYSATQIRFDEKQASLGTDSYKADQLLDKLRGGTPPTESIVVESLGQTVDEPSYRAFASTLLGEVRALKGVKSVSSYYENGDQHLVSKDRTKMVLPVTLNGTEVEAADNVAPLVSLLESRTKSGDGFRAITAGSGSIDRDLTETAQKDLEKGELIGMSAALVVLLLVFGAGVAAGVPVLLAIFGIALSVGVTALVSRFFGISSVTVNLITMIGLAVGIDYTLFIVERFREERAKGSDKLNAIALAGNTASRAVLFSGITVIIALSGLLIVPDKTFRGMAVGAITVVMAAVLIALTLLPALISLLNDKLNWLHLPGRGTPRSHTDNEHGFWGRSSALVMRHPLMSMVISIAILVGLASPFATIKLGNSGIAQMPAELNSVQAFKVLDKEFSAGRLAPAQVVIEGDVRSAAVQQSVAKLRQAVAADTAFGQIGEIQVSADGRIGAFPVIVNGDSSEAPARASVERLRHQYVAAAFEGSGAKVVVGGASAATTDHIDTMNTYLPIVIAFVLALSFVLLMVVFRSIVIPVKAIIMNLLSVGAAYGLLVIVFQHGVGANLLGFQQSDSIAAFLPVFLFAILFGLSMDYHVFLISRIHERFVQTRDNTAAVGYGLRSTAHIITGAAAIMMFVFAGFALGHIVELQQMGFGLAVAVFLDATIVRSILVPASMAMLGEWNWYLPSWLRWLPRISVEGGSVPEKEPRTEPIGPLVPEMIGAGGD